MMKQAATGGLVVIGTSSPGGGDMMELVAVLTGRSLMDVLIVQLAELFKTKIILLVPLGPPLPSSLPSPSPLPSLLATLEEHDAADSVKELFCVWMCVVYVCGGVSIEMIS